MLGDKCTSEGRFLCTDNTTRLMCTGGKWRLEHCIACSQKSLGTDETTTTAGCFPGGVGAEGAPCEGDTNDCDGNVLVQCVNGTYHRFTCNGPEGCTHQIDQLLCDTSVAKTGDPCRHDGDAACTKDGSAELHCKNGVYVADQLCRGAAGCKKTGRSALTCDASLGEVGDVCINGSACSLDHKSVLLCRGGKLTPGLTCRGTPAECRVGKTAVACADPNVGHEGDPCFEGTVCNDDGKSVLICQGGLYRKGPKCKSCKTVGTEVKCKK